MDQNSFRQKQVSFYDFIGNDEGLRVFLHNTHTEKVAESIIREGFRFVYGLSYTTDHISTGNVAEIDYFIVKRKYYGHITMLFGLGHQLYDKYTAKIKEEDVTECTDFVFADKTEEHSEDDHPIFILNRQFVKGFYNHRTQTGVYSPYFNPELDLPQFNQTFLLLPRK